VDIRVIATSNRDLEAEVRRGTFREDLLFRLNVINLSLPPLRERPMDLDLLADHFLRKYADVNGMSYRALSREGRHKLLAHEWRGNVRELENTMHRAVLLAQGPEVGPEAIMLAGSTAPTAASQPEKAGAAATDNGATPGAARSAVRTLVGRTVEEVERDLIIDTVYHCLGNRTHAANILGISIRTLRNKLKQYSEEGMAVPTPNEFERAPI
jgi:DNA-binding NtrC family response regulator